MLDCFDGFLEDLISEIAITISSQSAPLILKVSTERERESVEKREKARAKLTFLK